MDNGPFQNFLALDFVSVLCWYSKMYQIFLISLFHELSIVDNRSTVMTVLFLFRNRYIFCLATDFEL